MTPAELREAVAKELLAAARRLKQSIPLWEDAANFVHPSCGLTMQEAALYEADAALRVVREAMREPSDDMADAAIARRVSLNDGVTIYHGIWRAMLAASPLREE